MLFTGLGLLNNMKVGRWLLGSRTGGSSGGTGGSGSLCVAVYEGFIHKDLALTQTTQLIQRLEQLNIT